MNPPQIPGRTDRKGGVRSDSWKLVKTGRAPGTGRLRITGLAMAGWWLSWIVYHLETGGPRRDTTHLGRLIVHNLRVIELAKTQWAFDYQKTPIDTPSEADLAPFFNGGEFPRPIGGERYILNPIGKAPSAILTHQLGELPGGGEVTLPEM